MKVSICAVFVIFISFNPLFAQQIDLNAKVNLVALNAKKFTLSQLRKNTASVVIFFSPECPICTQMTKSVREMADSFSSRNIKFYLIYPGKYYSRSHIRKFQKEYLLKIDGFRDDNSELVKILGAKVTPQAFVIDARGEVIYSGKIDNWFEDIGKRRTIITEFYLQDALNSVIRHREPAIKETKPVGCFIDIH